MSAAWDALVLQHSARWIVTLDQTAREELHGWTADGAAYWVTLAPYTHPATLPKAGGGTWLSRGLYRIVTGASEGTTTGTTALTVKTNKADVQANAGSCWYDEANEKLYVRTSGSVHPDTLSAMYADFTLRFATESVNVAGEVPYRGLLDGSSLPAVFAERPNLLLATVVSTEGDVSFSNGDGLFDYLAERYVWEQGTATLKIGGAGFALSDYITLAVSQVSRPMTSGDLSAKLQLSARANALGSILQRTYRDSDNYGYSGPLEPAFNYLYSYYMPLFWGRVYNVPLTQYASEVVGQSKFFACDRFMKRPTVSAVYAVEKATGVRTILTEFTDYYNAPFVPDEWRIDIVTSAWSPDTYTFTADLDYRAGASMTYPQAGAILQDALELLGFMTAQINSTTFDAADALAPALLGVYIPGGPSSVIGDRVTGSDLATLLARSTLGDLQFDTDGRARLDPWDPSFDLDTVLTLHEPDILSWRPVETVTAHPTAKVQVFYKKEIGLGPDGVDRFAESVQDSSGEAAARLKKGETESVETALVDDADATPHAARLRLINDRQPLEWSLKTGAKLMDRRVGDKVRVVRPRGETLSGSFDRVLEIVKLTKQLATMECEATLGNMRGLGERVKRAAPSGGAAWSSATSDERRAYAYACDPTTGCVDTADPTTFQQAVSW